MTSPSIQPTPTPRLKEVGPAKLLCITITNCYKLPQPIYLCHLSLNSLLYLAENRWVRKLVQGDKISGIG